MPPIKQKQTNTLNYLLNRPCLLKGEHNGHVLRVDLLVKYNLDDLGNSLDRWEEFC